MGTSGEHERQAEPRSQALCTHGRDETLPRAQGEPGNDATCRRELEEEIWPTTLVVNICAQCIPAMFSDSMATHKTSCSCLPCDGQVSVYFIH